MELTGLQIRKMQMLDDLQKTIKEFEMKRIENDLLNTNKYLYYCLIYILTTFINFIILLCF